mmetsp:Transcript_57351/g.171033  ORF Transcript_57351/g.171033 Transcript_57351/m.171033 type:complete len:675 (-) Transcript_57351:78-2102(-)
MFSLRLTSYVLIVISLAIPNNPVNVFFDHQVVREVSSILRAKGVVPAVIAVKNGQCHVGLSDEELADLALAGEEGRAVKCSTRDLPLILARQAVAEGSHEAPIWGATTVASTMRLAHMAGIETFVTGGTGGVHRGAEQTMDVSADLHELARTPVLVVSAGVKSILDVRLTLEVLETMGVPVAAYGADDFPAFFSPRSGASTPWRIDSASEAATAFLAARRLGLPSGMLVAVPNNDPAGEAVESAIQEALIEAAEAEIVGRDVTPFVLSRVSEKTAGDSLRSNTALVSNNAEVAADIAVAISEAALEEPPSLSLCVESFHGDEHVPKFHSVTSSFPSSSHPEKLPTSRVVVLGGSVVDLVAKPEEGTDLIPGTSNPGRCSESDGGVGRNVAEVLGRLGASPILYSAVGNDYLGQGIISRLEDECGVVGARKTVATVSGENNRTATYLAVMNSLGDLHTAIADAAVLQHIPVPSQEVLAAADVLVMDANAPIDTLARAARSAVDTGVDVFFEPTSVPKASMTGRSTEFLSCLTYAFPNVAEILAMADGWSDSPEDIDEACHDDLKTLKTAALELLRQMRPQEAHIIITMGEDGVLLASRHGPGAKPIFSHFPPEDGVVVENSTGAGDTLCGAFVKARLDGHEVASAVKIGMEAAVKSLQCRDRAISPTLSSKISKC